MQVFSLPHLYILIFKPRKQHGPASKPRIRFVHRKRSKPKVGHQYCNVTFQHTDTQTCNYVNMNPRLRSNYVILQKKNMVETWFLQEAFEVVAPKVFSIGTPSKKKGVWACFEPNLWIIRLNLYCGCVCHQKRIRIWQELTPFHAGPALS